MKYKPLLVIHESIYSYDQVLNHIKNPSTTGAYHCFIRLDGHIIYMAPSNRSIRASYPSSFNDESINNSVDPFSYHICLETPLNTPYTSVEHSGYTIHQYNSLAYVYTRTGISPDRVTLHKDIDDSGEVIDPRSFEFSKLWESLPLDVRNIKLIDLGF